MNGKICNAWDSFRYFCAAHTVDFYVGMALSVLLLLNLFACVSFGVGAAITAVATPLFYLMIRALIESPATWKGNPMVRNGMIASEIGCTWAILLTLL